MKLTEQITKCGCKRSPSGNCCGWHSLTEEQYLKKLQELLQFESKEATGKK